jgi:hypothetical protein
MSVNPDQCNSCGSLNTKVKTKHTSWRKPQRYKVCLACGHKVRKKYGDYPQEKPTRASQNSQTPKNPGQLFEL